MKITYQDFISYIQNNDSQNLNKIRNFYYTFGYLILADGISNAEIELLRNRVLSMSEKLLDKDSRNRPIVDKTIIMHKALEGDADTLDWFVNQNQYLRIIRFLLGDNAAFFCSDANLFIHAASWHRDVATFLPTLKFLVYLQDSNHANGAGDFAVIPGSHWVTDAYSSYLNANGSWPSGTPFSHNYYGYFDNSMLRKFRRRYDGSEFPFHTIKVRKNDVILFDNRLYHTTYIHPVSKIPFFRKKKFTRLNFSALFIANPMDLSPDSWLHERLPQSEVRDELDNFYQLISNFEDCRYHINLKDTSRYEGFRQHLYFGKYGYTSEAENIFNSAGAQNDLEVDLKKRFISPKKLNILP